jgi:hypothetical protein
VIVTLALLCAGAPASAQSPPEIVGPYDGQIPFRCQLQNVGTGTAFPDPAADPFCVEFDKTNQNVTDLGILEFALQEPARVAAAVTKCFYFQRDHWTGSIVQGQEPELYHWDGDYWFDVARGVGGASVRNLRIGGVPMDATPFVPAAYQPFFDPNGGGGVMVELELNPPSHCTSKVDTPQERDRVYAGRPEFMGCIEPGGEIRRNRVGGLALGMRRKQVVGHLGIPHDHRRGVDRWCLIGKGSLRAGYRGAGGPAELIATSSRGHVVSGVARGDSAKRARERLRLRPRFRLGTRHVLEARSGGPLVVVGGGRVRWFALADRRLAAADGVLRRALRRAL